MGALIRSAAKLMAGTGAAQAVALLMLPVISRIYPPAEFGIFSAMLVPIGLATILATLQMQYAIMLPKLYAHATKIFKTGLFSILVVSVAFFAVGFVIFIHLGYGLSGSFITGALCALAVAGCGFGQLAQGLAIREGKFSTVAHASVARAVGVAVLQYTLGVYGLGVWGLLTGYLAGEVAASAILWRKLSFKIFSSNAGGDLRVSFVVMRRYSDFGKFGVAQEFVNSLSQGLPVMMLGYGYGQAVAGAYAMVMRLLNAPVQLIGNAIRQVVYRELARADKPAAERYRLFRDSTLWLAVPAIAGCMLASPFLPHLLPMFLGRAWSLAGVFAVPLVFWVALLMSNAPASAVFRIARRQGLSLIYSLLLLLLRLAVLLLAIIYLASRDAVWAYSILGVVMNFVYIDLARRVFKGALSKERR